MEKPVLGFWLEVGMSVDHVGANVDVDVDRLMRAIEEGDVETLEGLKKEKKEVIVYPKYMCAAARSGNVDVVKRLLELGGHPQAEGDAGGKKRLSVLTHAADAGHLEVCRVLVEAGADTDYHDGRGIPTPLLKAVTRNDRQMALFLLGVGALPFGCDGNGWTPLHHAASHGDVDVVEALVGVGADCLAESWDGDTPVSLATACGSVEVLEVLGDAILNPPSPSSDDDDDDDDDGAVQ